MQIGKEKVAFKKRRRTAGTERRQEGKLTTDREYAGNKKKDDRQAARRSMVKLAANLSSYSLVLPFLSNNLSLLFLHPNFLQSFYITPGNCIQSTLPHLVTVSIALYPIW